MNYFQTSCNFSTATPEISEKVNQFVQKNYGLTLSGCCLKSHSFSSEDLIYYLCQNCRNQLESITDAQLLSFYLILDEDKNFPWPDYEGHTFFLQDCFRDRNHLEIHKAVRSILKKMNINVLEIEKNKEKADFCGTLYFAGERCIDWDNEKKITYMKSYCAQFGEIPIITYCNRCRKDIRLANQSAFHILELIFR
ncbi:MAG: hypothetical protein Q4C49_03610 [Bacillota bacterium]|nr:hypothetical protein [Bacillota bacterium]